MPTPSHHGRTMRSGIYIVPTDRWYIERTVWLVAGIFLIANTALAALHDPRWIVFTAVTGLFSVSVSLNGFCVAGVVLHADRPLVSGAADLRRRRRQHHAGVDPQPRSQRVVARLHPLRRPGHALVRRDRLLHHGELPLLARLRTAAGREARGRGALPHGVAVNRLQHRGFWGAV